MTTASASVRRARSRASITKNSSSTPRVKSIPLGSSNTSKVWCSADTCRTYPGGAGPVERAARARGLLTLLSVSGQQNRPLVRLCARGGRAWEVGLDGGPGAGCRRGLWRRRTHPAAGRAADLVGLAGGRARHRGGRSDGRRRGEPGRHRGAHRDRGRGGGGLVLTRRRRVRVAGGRGHRGGGALPDRRGRAGRAGGRHRFERRGPPAAGVQLDRRRPVARGRDHRVRRTGPGRGHRRHRRRLRGRGVSTA